MWFLIQLALCCLFAVRIAMKLPAGKNLTLWALVITLLVTPVFIVVSDMIVLKTTGASEAITLSNLGLIDYPKILWAYLFSLCAVMLIRVKGIRL